MSLENFSFLSSLSSSSSKFIPVPVLLSFPPLPLPPPPPPLPLPPDPLESLSKSLSLLSSDGSYIFIPDFIYKYDFAFVYKKLDGPASSSFNNPFDLSIFLAITSGHNISTF
jgi:hypothetical protein